MAKPNSTEARIESEFEFIETPKARPSTFEKFEDCGVPTTSVRYSGPRHLQELSHLLVSRHQEWASSGRWSWKRYLFECTPSRLDWANSRVCGMEYRWRHQDNRYHSRIHFTFDSRIILDDHIRS